MIALPQVPGYDLRLLEKIYAALPKMRCKGKCQGSCGPLALSRVEYDVLATAGGPAVYDDPRGDLSGRCSKLVAGRCSAYAVRPLICRLYGMTPALACPHGCEPDRWVSGEEFDIMLCEIRNAYGDALTSTHAGQAKKLEAITNVPVKNSAIRLFS